MNTNTFQNINVGVDIGYINNKQAASLIGVAPITKESGRYKGKERSKVVVLK